MAILKMISTCHPTKAGNNVTLRKCIDYALNPKKTQNGLYTGATNCNKNTALNDMVQTKQFYGKDSSDKKVEQDIIGLYHGHRKNMLTITLH